MIAGLPYLDTLILMYEGLSGYFLKLILSWGRTLPRCNTEQIKITTKATS